MTQNERENPKILKDETSRIARIAKGAGVATSDVRALIKQYDILSTMIKETSGDLSGGISQKHLQKMLKKFGKKGLRI